MSVKKVHNKDVFQRINFLHQASHLMADKNNKTLSSFYGNLLKQIQRKSVIKIDSSIKRDFCKRCSLAFTVKTCDLSANENGAIIVECQKCKLTKSYKINDQNKLWCDSSEARKDVVEIN